MAFQTHLSFHSSLAPTFHHSYFWSSRGKMWPLSFGSFTFFPSFLGRYPLFVRLGYGPLGCWLTQALRTQPTFHRYSPIILVSVQTYSWCQFKRKLRRPGMWVVFATCQTFKWSKIFQVGFICTYE